MSNNDDATMPFLLLAAFNDLVDSVHEQLAAEGFPGIRASHGFAMQAIGNGCTSVELGRRLEVTKQAAAQTARTLEELGLIARVPNQHDKRALTLTPTDRGTEMLQRSAAAFRARMSVWRHIAGDDDISTMMTALHTVTEIPPRRADGS